MSPVFDKKTKILFAIVGGIVLTTLYLSYIKFLTTKDFLVFVRTTCNPISESCFVWDCDVENDVRCEGQARKFYKVVEKRGYAIPPAECETGDVNCTTYFCTTANKDLFETEDLCDDEL